MHRWICTLIITLAPALGRAQACGPSLADVPVGVRIETERYPDGTLKRLRFYDDEHSFALAQAQAHYIGNEVGFIIFLDKENPERALFGRDIVRLGLAMAEGQVDAVRTSWVGFDNLERYNRMTALGMDGDEAARLTWTGRTLARHGYTDVTLAYRHQFEGQYVYASYVFRRPSASAE